MGEVRESKRKGDAEAPSCLRFCSLLPDCTVRVLWVDSESKEGNEAEFARLDTGVSPPPAAAACHSRRL